MPVIDADTHVDESEATWKKLEGTLRLLWPFTIPGAAGGATRQS